jgi:SNF2 family DNA or RNA helicase
MNNYLSYENFSNNFIKIYSSNNITLNKSIKQENIVIFSQQSRHYICDVTETNYHFNYYDNNNNNKTMFTEDTSLNIYSNQWNSTVIMYPFCNWKKEISDQMRNAFRQLRNLTINKSIIIKLEQKGSECEYELCYYINKEILNKLKNGKNLTTTHKKYIDSFFNKINKDNINKNIIKCFEKIIQNEPTNVKLDESKYINSNLLKDAVKLFNYQIQNINWMKSIENNINENKNQIDYFFKPTFDIIISPQYSFTVYQETILPYKNYNLSHSLKYYGGNLCDEMGLGKSLCMLYHLFSKEDDNLYDNFIEYNENKCNYFYKRGKYKGTHCIKKCFSELYCKEHNESIFIDKRSTTLKNIEEFNINNYILIKNECDTSDNDNDNDNDNDHLDLDKTIYKTNASLIICPNQLCDQWVREYYDKFAIKKRIILIATSDQFNNLTFADILFADLIVISYNLLLNNCYKSIKNKIDHSMSNENILKTKIHNLNTFYFNTIVHDEFHEIDNMNKSRDIFTKIKSLESKFKWNISGTPFANNINSFRSGFELISNIISKEIIVELIEKCQILYRRNTKEYIKNNEKFVKNIINEQVKLLSFTKEERTIYDAHNKSDKNYDFLIQLCCHPEVIVSETKDLIKNCKTLDEIQKVLLTFNKNKLNTLTIEINNLTQNISDLEFELQLYIDDHNIDMLKYKQDDNIEIDNFKSLLGTNRRNLTNKKKEYDSVKRVYDYFETCINNIKNEQIETCPICLDESDLSNIAITKCGHTFCWDCINELIAINNYNLKCPKCTQPIVKSEIYQIKKEQKLQIENKIQIENNELNNLIQNIKSTKIGNIIYYINNELKDTDKCIIFSQYDTLLHKIGDILKKYKKDVKYCTGSVYQRKRSINSFTKNNDTNIIMLSSENAASGINLTVANKIILVEPVYGDSQYRKDIEAQAIGRADRIGQKKEIDVIRFIIKDTIEEKLLNESYNKEINHIVKETKVLEI